jgi:hypothetical protein
MGLHRLLHDTGIRADHEDTAEFVQKQFQRFERLNGFVGQVTVEIVNEDDQRTLAFINLRVIAFTVHPNRQQAFKGFAEIIEAGGVFLEFGGRLIFFEIRLKLELRAQSAKTHLKGAQEHAEQIVRGLFRVFHPHLEFADEAVTSHGKQDAAYQRHQQFLFLVVLPRVEPDRFAGAEILLLAFRETMRGFAALPFDWSSIFFTRINSDVLPEPHAPLIPMASGVSVCGLAIRRANVAAKSSK